MPAHDAPDATYRARIELLSAFLADIRAWHDAESQDDQSMLRSRINRNLVAVRQTVAEAGCRRLMTLAPPPMIGGPIVHNVDPFDILFTGYFHASMVPEVADMVEQAVGVYEHLERSDGLVRADPREVVDIHNAIERALRPAFRVPPENEKQVQDEIETILNALGIGFHREKETAPVGPKAFRPDFTVPSNGLAIEVKFANANHSAADIQEEIAADIAAYATKWKRLLVVVYDVGAIADPHKFRADNMKHFGVTVIVVKH